MSSPVSPSDHHLCFSNTWIMCTPVSIHVGSGEGTQVFNTLLTGYLQSLLAPPPPPFFLPRQGLSSTHWPQTHYEVDLELLILLPLLPEVGRTGLYRSTRLNLESLRQTQAPGASFPSTNLFTTLDAVPRCLCNSGRLYNSKTKTKASQQESIPVNRSFLRREPDVTTK